VDTAAQKNGADRRMRRLGRAPQEVSVARGRHAAADE
jgi:hypothetical protein